MLGTLRQRLSPFLVRSLAALPLPQAGEGEAAPRAALSKYARGGEKVPLGGRDLKRVRSHGINGAVAELSKPSTKTVLIVDDDESVLNLLEILIKRDGFKVDLAASGDRALSRLDAKPDAMVLDLMLPGSTTGFEVLRKLREGLRAVPPIVVVTAYGTDPEVKKLEADPNVVAVLAKPINQERLLTALHRALGTEPPVRKKPEAGA